MTTPETVVTGDVNPSGAPPVETPETAVSPPAATNAGETETKEKSGVSKRIDELTRLRRDAERERDRWYEIAMRQQQAPTPAQTPPPATEQPQGLKTLADFGWDEKAFAKHLLEQAAPKPEVLRQTYRELQEQEARAALVESFRSREAEFAKDHEDYEEVAYYAPISDSVAQMLQETEEGPELAYYLGKNPDIARKLSKLTPGAAGVELGKLSAKLASEKEKASQPSVSRTPPPTPKVEGADAGTSVKSTSDPDADKLPIDQWLKLRQKEVNRRRS